MNTLHVLYDAECPVCLRLREWLTQQAAIIPLHFLPHHAAETACRFPGVATHLTPRELTVVSDAGQVWTGLSAVVMCLFALEQHRELAERLALPNVLPLAGTAVELLRREVFELTGQLRRSSPVELENLLRLNAEVVRKHPHLPPALPPARA